MNLDEFRNFNGLNRSSYEEERAFGRFVYFLSLRVDVDTLGAFEGGEVDQAQHQYQDLFQGKLYL